MRIAIITFSDFNTNYGSRLQAYSLANFLERNGHEVEFIRYREFNKTPIPTSIRAGVSLIASKAIKVIDKNNRDKRNVEFNNFSEKFLNHTRLYTSNDELKFNLPEYDCYICGSDQIWNLECLGGLRTPYFLDFVPKGKLKIAYAPSFGNYKIDYGIKNQISKLIEGFDALSVREFSGVNMLQKYTNKKIEHVLDPAFLTSKEEWEEILPSIEDEKEFGICYLVRRSKECNKLISNLKNIKGTTIYNLSDNSINVRGTSNKYITSGPLEFLSLIKNAKFAIGTSFHLAVFSIIFNIPFVIVGMKSNESRLKSLLENLGCEDRFITVENINEEKILELLQNNDMKSINSKLLKEIKNSKKYLIDSINKSKK
ncbi:polysaccharide pyruvyl transferase family protein [Clostridium perfringens]|uniref:polysaccharide pyruvyl transferase family protein n=1 Tax=Clostridium perfringens TaxID=1502 RepID=UPI001DA48732|nr:polysaccharide pyruvyl transferase family protein [Clostridium perfringens]EHK2338408.1 polysaccharide pyruvyl transferase family protein [Clostridium perfringens]MCC5421804.1 polysaccharide pyruvyl transferase family protein [Clostridium perfringens]MCC5431734.1 polysaccharide pyruvyl transferase family protein [Clostridium perfringens]MDK0553182.1 polysaccharide pyruvyl transferase family protein [Clostridium perfringens]MDK0855096.1 polysaccharide pyruvyl transferase family protein [Clos